MWQAWLVLLAALLLPTWAHADEVKTSGFWIKGTILDIEDGELVFRTQTGAETSRPMNEIEGIRVEAHPEFEKAVTLIDEGQDEEAIKLLSSVVGKSRQDWLKFYANSLLVGAADRAGQARVAVDAYLPLLTGGADASIIPDPPTASVSRADDAVKQRIFEKAQATLNRVPREYREDVVALMRAAQVEPPEVEQQPENDGEANDLPELEDTEQTPDMHGFTTSKVILPIEEVLPRDEISGMLMAGEFEEAKQAAEEALGQVGGTSRELYQLGMAQLGLAQASGDPEDYKTAALSFMRVVIHFERTSRLSSYCLAEAAYCHALFGRHDIARELIEQASNAITEDEDANYARRIEMISQRIADNP